MPVSHYFNNYSGTETNEMKLYQDVVDESINIMGHNCWYIPRENFDESDFVFGENVNSKFSSAYLMAFYLKNISQYDGDGEFFSKFGLEIRDVTSLIVSRPEFKKTIPSNILNHPREGDLIYVPVLQKLMEIKYVEEELFFFSMGKRDPYAYELRCEAFRYSNENIQTGVEEVDDIEFDNAFTVTLNLGTGSGNYHIGERVFQGANIAYSFASGDVKNWEPTTKTLYVVNTKGEFRSNTSVTGLTSNTSYNISVTDSMADNVQNDIFDNKRFNDQANTIIDITEINLFGKVT